jgi:hypothetical protein
VAESDADDDRGVYDGGVLIMFRKQRAAPPIDPGLQQIDEWLKCFTAFNADRLGAWPAGPLLDTERATVAALGNAIRERMITDYLARSKP